MTFRLLCLSPGTLGTVPCWQMLITYWVKLHLTFPLSIFFHLSPLTGVGWFYVSVTQAEVLWEGKLSWKHVPIRWACGTFSWLTVDVGGPSSLEVVPPWEDSPGWYKRVAKQVTWWGRGSKLDSPTSNSRLQVPALFGSYPTSFNGWLSCRAISWNKAFPHKGPNLTETSLSPHYLACVIKLNALLF